MKDTERLYGIVNTRRWQEMNYVEVLMLKAQSAESVVEMLMQSNLADTDMVRLNDCLQAAKFNRELIREVFHGTKSRNKSNGVATDDKDVRGHNAEEHC